MGNQIQQLDSTALCVKYLLFAMNFLYFATGVAALSVAAWIFSERNFIAEVFSSQMMTAASILLIICGSLIILISFFGCTGALLENRCMILTYFILVATLFLSMVVSGVLAFIFRSQIGDEVRGVMRTTLRDSYGKNDGTAKVKAITDAWDQTQAYLYCCSVDYASWSTYENSEWYKLQPGVPRADKPYVPLSCCVRDQYKSYVNIEKCQLFPLGPPARVDGEPNEALHHRGCYDAGRDFAFEYTGYLIGLAFGIGLSMILGLVCAIYLYMKLNRY